jgi:hypothetical protein
MPKAATDQQHTTDPDKVVLRPKQIERELNTSWKTIRRARPDKVVKLGKRAVGMERGHARASVP